MEEKSINYKNIKQDLLISWLEKHNYIPKEEKVIWFEIALELNSKLQGIMFLTYSDLRSSQIIFENLMEKIVENVENIIKYQRKIRNVNIRNNL